jgi:hypothetical protein
VNAIRLLLSLLLVALPALALTAVRVTRRPRAWAFVLAMSLGTGLVLVEVSLIHEALPLILTTLGFPHLAEACRSLGGHLFGGTPQTNIAGLLLAVTVVYRATRGVSGTVRAQANLRNGLGGGSFKTVAGRLAVVLPMSQPGAVAIPGHNPLVVVWLICSIITPRFSSWVLPPPMVSGSCHGGRGRLPHSDWLWNAGQTSRARPAHQRSEDTSVPRYASWRLLPHLL